MSKVPRPIKNYAINPNCKVCKGWGSVLVVPDFAGDYCNCGSGEGCYQHDDFWKQEKPCPLCSAESK